MSEEEADFEADMEEALGDEMRESRPICIQVWSALANIIWTHTSGKQYSRSFRSAGGLIARIRRDGDYMDWYCSGPYAEVSDLVAAAMLKKGWKPRTWEEEDRECYKEKKKPNT